jgi:regulator of sirC expression with transglutaminase-like and TPR domain
MEPSARFAALVASERAQPPLDLAMALIARCATPALDVEAPLARLDELAATCPSATFEAVVRHLFGPGRLRGDRTDYGDPRNSLLDQVLARRLGIPISLCAVAVEVGRRLDVPIDGIGMPGHFLVRDPAEPGRYCDPFHDGRMLDPPACRALHRQVVGARAVWDDSFLDAVDHRSILVRMLTNLKVSYRRRGDVAALRWVMTLRAAFPELAAAERREFDRLMAPTN